MNILDKNQRHLLADYLNNISAGWFLLGVVTPFITKIKIDSDILLSIFFSILFSLSFISFGIYLVKN